MEPQPEGVAFVAEVAAEYAAEAAAEAFGAAAIAAEAVFDG